MIIENESDEIGYCLIEPQDKWKPARADVEGKQEEAGGTIGDGCLKFETGLLTANVRIHQERKDWCLFDES